MNKIHAFVLIFSLSCGSLSAAESSSRANSVARALALKQLAGTSSRIETLAFKYLLLKFARLGIKPGPFCVQLTKGCYTRQELNYKASDYYELAGLGLLPKAGLYTSIYEARFPREGAIEPLRKVAQNNHVGELELVYSLEAKERLEISYLEAYGKSHPVRAPRTEGNLHYTYSWRIDDNGMVVQHEAIEGDGD